MIKEIVLERHSKMSEYTIGKLIIDGKYFCDTLEDVVRNQDIKVHGKTAIPFGRYKIIMNMSNRFKKIMPLLLNVPNFEGVRIHAGNFAENTEGCVLCGKNTAKGQLTNSKLWTSMVYSKINEYIDNGFEVYITIK